MKGNAKYITKNTILGTQPFFVSLGDQSIPLTPGLSDQFRSTSGHNKYFLVRKVLFFFFPKERSFYFYREGPKKSDYVGTLCDKGTLVVCTCGVVRRPFDVTLWWELIQPSHYLNKFCFHLIVRFQRDLGIF